MKVHSNYVFGTRGHSGKECSLKLIGNEVHLVSELDVGDALNEIDSLHGGEEGGEGRGLSQRRVGHDRGCHEGYLRSDRRRN